MPKPSSTPEPSLNEELSDAQLVKEYDNKGDLLVGNVYDLLDKKHWDFGQDDGSSHPGACYDFDTLRREALLLKGTSKDPGRRRQAYVAVEPDEENKLAKTTYFDTREIHDFRSRVIENAHHDRLRGKLAASDLEAIRLALNEFTREDD